MSTDDVVEVVITAPDADWLAGFVHRLVEDNVVAGAHLVAPIRSIYRWRGRVQDKSEARVVLHTITAHVPTIIARANADHPYEVPCVLSLPVLDGNPDYIDWIRTETGPTP